jgi:hypothetical protein
MLWVIKGYEGPGAALRALVRSACFALYEAVPVGCVDRVVRGGLLDVLKIPVPDAETVVYTASIAT